MTEHHTYIQRALDIRAKSQHETYKVGAVLVGDGFEVAKPNFYPEPLEHTIGHHQKLGNASTTVHAEIAAILNAPAKLDNAALYITQRPCPNCAKAIVESGIREVYVSADTRDTVLGQKIKPFFENASLPFLTHAGISVFEVDEDIISLNAPLQCSDEGLKPADFHGNFEDALAEQPEPFAACIAQNHVGNRYFLCARAKTPHCLPHDRARMISDIQRKYETALQPLNRLLIACARHGLRIDKHFIYSSQTPTSREFVNFIGAGLSHLRIGDETMCRDEWGLKALKQLKAHNIINLL